MSDIVPFSAVPIGGVFGWEGARYVKISGMDGLFISEAKIVAFELLTGVYYFDNLKICAVCKK
jgi:hypothetical protein